MRITDKYVFFWRTAESFSNWYSSKFSFNGVSFTSSEQAMMYHKAKLMGDELSMSKILKTHNPKAAKALGRKIQNFDENQWVASREKIVTDILVAKFSSNETLKKELLETGDRVIVEASPYDKIWGIGMG